MKTSIPFISWLLLNEQTITGCLEKKVKFKTDLFLDVNQAFLTQVALFMISLTTNILNLINSENIWGHLLDLCKGLGVYGEW